jgi:hypothetical protein
VLVDPEQPTSTEDIDETSPVVSEEDATEAQAEADNDATSNTGEEEGTADVDATADADSGEQGDDATTTEE